MKELKGTVISTKMQKTVVVSIERSSKHPLYKKIVKRSKGFKADSQNHDLKEGDQVKIKETRPLSKGKHWIVTEVLKKQKS